MNLSENRTNTLIILGIIQTVNFVFQRVSRHMLTFIPLYCSPAPPVYDAPIEPIISTYSSIGFGGKIFRNPLFT